MPAGIYLTAAELHGLRGLPHSAAALYLALRARMDYATAIVGAPTGISWQALVEDLYIEPHRGTPHPSPGREAVRRVCAWLIAAELVQLRSNRMQAQLLFRLPAARTLSRARNQADWKPTGKADRGEGADSHSAPAELSTETRPTARRLSRQTSGNTLSQQPAVATIDSAALLWPVGTSPAQQRAFGAIGRKHGLTRDELQLCLDELAGKQRHAKVQNPPAMMERFAVQLRAGELWAGYADQERQGGAGLSAEEARFLNEGVRA